jgi:hypothetical protein
MGKRGPKPVHVGTLNVWEFEWYKALHLLRDGSELPPDPVAERVNQRMTTAQLAWWRKATPKEILGDMLRLDPPAFTELPTTEERVRAKRKWIEQEKKWLWEFAELERQSEIAELEKWLKPREIHARSERRKTWEELIRARTVSTLKKACEDWKRWIVLSSRFHKKLPDGRIEVFGFPGPDYVTAHAREFFRMKGKGTRFPRSSYSDESRLEYLARGMAGVLVGVSPQTAIERLRNMKHDRGGPLWSNQTGRCECWRCRLRQSRVFCETLEKTQLQEATI